MVAAELANEKRRHGDLATPWRASSLAPSTRGHLPRRLKQARTPRDGIQTSETLPRLTTETTLKASSDSLIKKGGLFSPPFKMIIGYDRVNDSALRSIRHHWSHRHLVDDHRRSDHRAEFARRRGTLVSAEESSLGVEDGFETTLVMLRDDLGLTLHGQLKAAAVIERLRPVLLLLGGIETGRETVVRPLPSARLRERLVKEVERFLTELRSPEFAERCTAA